LRHGLRAETLPLPNEDPTVVAARAEAWNTYYKPQSPAAQHLVNRCVNATLLADRCDRYHTAALTTQIRNAPLLREYARENELDRLFEVLHSDPDTAVRDLGRTAYGCRWLLGRWTPLAEAFQKNHHWTDAERDDATLLFRFKPSEARTNPEVYKLKLYNLLADGQAPDEVVDGLRDPYFVPLELAGVFDTWLPDSEVCRDTIIELVTGTIQRLKEDEALLREMIDEPDRAEESERAMILTDPDQARLVLRYQAEARTSFHRSYTELVRTLKRDASGPYPELMSALIPEDGNERCDCMSTSPGLKPADLAPSAPEPAAAAVLQVVAPEPVAVISPNEAKPAVVAAVAGALEAGFGVFKGPEPIHAAVNVDPKAPPGGGITRRRPV
jgi:hypothetical protein